MKMVCLTLLMVASLLNVSALAETLNGYVAFQNGQTFFIDGKSQKVSPARAGTQSVQNSFQKLKNHDAISGQGKYINEVLVIDSIEFVGLRRLLGVWQAPDAVVNFTDFSTVSFFLPQPAAIPETSATKVSFRYAVSPSLGSGWRVFFSSDDNVVLGLLTVNQTQAQIELFDPNTGDIGQTIQLEKVKTTHGLDLN